MWRTKKSSQPNYSLDPAHHIPKVEQDQRTWDLHLLGRHLLDPDVAPITWSSPILLKFWDMMDWVKTSCAGYLFSCATCFHASHHGLATAQKKLKRFLYKFRFLLKCGWAGLGSETSETGRTGSRFCHRLSVQNGMRWVDTARMQCGRLQHVTPFSTDI